MHVLIDNKYEVYECFGGFLAKHVLPDGTISDEGKIMVDMWWPAWEGHQYKTSLWGSGSTPLQITQQAIHVFGTARMKAKYIPDYVDPDGLPAWEPPKPKKVGRIINTKAAA